MAGSTRPQFAVTASCVAAFFVASACTLDTEGLAPSFEADHAGSAATDASIAGAPQDASTSATGGTGSKDGAAGNAQGGAAGLGGSQPHGGASGQAGSQTQGGSAGQAGAQPQGGSTGQAGAQPQGGSAGQAEGGSAGTAGSAGLGGSTGQAGSGGGVVVYDPPWWNPAFHTRYRIDVHNGASDALPVDFQIKVPVASAQLDKATAPFDSWRIVRWNAATNDWSILPRFIDHRGAQQWIWFRSPAPIPAGSKDSDTFLYVDNKAPPAVGSDPSVFDVFSPFDAPSVEWAQQGSAAYANGFVVLDGAGAGASIRSKTTWAPGHAVDFEMTIVKPVAGTNAWLCGGFQRQTDFVDTRPWSLWISRTAARIKPEFWSAATGDFGGTPVDVDSPNSHFYSVERFSKAHVFLRDFVIADELTYATAFDLPMQIRFTAYGGSRIRVDYARIRKAVNPAPTAKLSPAEKKP